MGPDQNFLTWVWSCHVFSAHVGLGWVSYTFPKKFLFFNFLPSDQKKISMGWVKKYLIKDRLAPYLLWVRRLHGSGWIRPHLYTQYLSSLWAEQQGPAQLEMDPDLTRTYFWPPVNKMLTRLWPGYFLTQPEKIFLPRVEKFDIFRGNFPNLYPNQRWLTRPEQQKFDPSQPGLKNFDPDPSLCPTQPQQLVQLKEEVSCYQH